MKFWVDCLTSGLGREGGGHGWSGAASDDPEKENPGSDRALSRSTLGVESAEKLLKSWQIRSSSSCIVPANGICSKIGPAPENQSLEEEEAIFWLIVIFFGVLSEKFVQSSLLDKLSDILLTFCLMHPLQLINVSVLFLFQGICLWISVELMFLG